MMMLALLLQTDPAPPDYKPEGQLDGRLCSVGSDTMHNVMTLWAEALKKAHPAVEVEIEGKGTSSPPPALISGRSHLAPMTRPFKPAEREAFEAKFGYPPLSFEVAWDALAVFVHKENPIRSLTLEQVDAVFSSSRRRKGKEVRTWGDLGLQGAWAPAPIVLYGRHSAAGSYGFFKERVLLNGDFKEEAREEPGTASVVMGCAADRHAIGYGGVGYMIPGVRAVPLAGDDGPVEAAKENALSGAYPLARPLLLYVNQAPGKPLDPRVREFLRLVFSKEGQEAVVKDGYFPVTAAHAVRERKKLD